MSTSLNGLIPQFRPWAQQLIRVAEYNRLSPRVTSTRRSRSTQARLYRTYLAGNALFPAAAPGTSAHEFGYAMDMVTTPLDALRSLGSLWRSWGGLWGANDVVHFEYPGFPHQAVQNDPDTFLDSVVSFLPKPAQIAYDVALLHSGHRERALSGLLGPLGEYLFPAQR